MCVAKARMHVFKVFVSSAKCSPPDQHKTHSLLAINAFACNVISYSEVNSRGYVVAVAITSFVCSVISCSEESSRGYLIASDDAFVCSVILYMEVKRAIFEN